ncbi:MAG: hypothetical protein WDZ52_13400 [Pseudohongiellaceae bacterium]
MQLPGTHSLFLAAALGLSACTSMPIDFARMDAAELMAYNRSVKLWDQVHCVDEIRSGSHIRRRHCSTLLDIYSQLERSQSAINVRSASRVY